MEHGNKCVAASVFGILLCGVGTAQVTTRASVSSTEHQGNADCISNAISADGRYVAFESLASNLVPGDTNAARDIFVRDRWLGTTERVSVSSAGAQNNGDDFWAPFVSISADGRFVGFSTNGSNLVAGDTNAKVDVFIRDRQLGITERVSVDSNGVQSDNESRESAISADGRYVAFRSGATNLVPGDTNGWSDIFVRDRLLGTTVRVSVDSAGGQGNSNSQSPVISPDGRYVAFGGYASNLVPGDTNGVADVFVHDMQTGLTERITHSFSGGEANGSCIPSSMSADARFVAFEGWADNLVQNDTNNFSDAFVVDRQTGTIERVSVSTSGVQSSLGILMSEYPSPAMSADGRYVAFTSESIDLINGDTNGFPDVFVHDRALGTTLRASVGTESIQGDGWGMYPAISADGRYISFTDYAGTFDPNDTNGDFDIYVRDGNPTNFTSLCDPGFGGVLACPCGNPPSGPGRGCDNSAATGGAILSATGSSYLSADSLRLTASAERMTAFSILTQWLVSNPNGAIFGMGVRCATGTFKRLYSRNAVAGTVYFPDPNHGDPPVSARSAALGDVIQIGQSRWYLVYYRDPNVLGGCPASSTFNATQTGQVTWSP